MREIKKLQARGIYDPDKEDPFELFISSTNIRWAYYKESHKILGNTYGMCVLQVRWALEPPLQYIHGAYLRDYVFSTGSRCCLDKHAGL